jgi:hypothetical protein
MVRAETVVEFGPEITRPDFREKFERGGSRTLFEPTSSVRRNRPVGPRPTERFMSPVPTTLPMLRLSTLRRYLSRSASSWKIASIASK